MESADKQRRSQLHGSGRSQFNERNTVFVRWLQADQNTRQGDPLNARPQVFPGFPPLGEVFRATKNLAISYRQTISSRVVNEFTAGFARFVFLFTQGEANAAFHDVLPFTSSPGGTTNAFNNTISLPYINTPRTFRAVTTPQFLDNLSIVTGAQVFRTGANVRLYEHNDQRGQPGGTNVTPLMSFMQNIRTPAGFNTPVVGARSIDATDSNNLNGVYVPDKPVGAGLITFRKTDRWYERNNAGAIAPRVGVAWSPRPDFVIRSGYGIAFDPISSFQVTAVSGKVPGPTYSCSATVGAATTPGCASVADIRIGQGFPLELPPPTVKPSSFLTPPVEQTTLAAKLRPNQQFAKITYLDSGGDSYYHSAQATLRKRFGDGLQAGLAYTLGKSMDDQSVDPVGATSGGALSTTNSRTPTDTRDWRQERGRSDFDRRHVLIVNSLWELPVGRQKRFASSIHPVLNHVVVGWSLNGIYTFMSGEPFSVRSGVRTSNFSHESRADIVGAKPQVRLQEVPGVIGPVVFKDASAFAIPAPGTNGAGRNIFEAPGYWNLDLGIGKRFQLTERFNLQFRAEMFNALNHANFDNPRDASSGSPSIRSTVFAQTCCQTVAPPTTQTIISTGEAARVIQFALKMLW